MEWMRCKWMMRKRLDEWNVEKEEKSRERKKFGATSSTERSRASEVGLEEIVTIRLEVRINTNRVDFDD